MHEEPNFDLKDRQDTARLPKPPGKWRTCWESMVDGLKVNRTVYNKGEKFKGLKIWPCRDSAETHGKEREKSPPNEVKFLGAEAEE